MITDRGHRVLSTLRSYIADGLLCSHYDLLLSQLAESTAPLPSHFHRQRRRHLSSMPLDIALAMYHAGHNGIGTVEYFTTDVDEGNPPIMGGPSEERGDIIALTLARPNNDMAADDHIFGQGGNLELLGTFLTLKGMSARASLIIKPMPKERGQIIQGFAILGSNTNGELHSGYFRYEQTEGYDPLDLFRLACGVQFMGEVPKLVSGAIQPNADALDWMCNPAHTATLYLSKAAAYIEAAHQRA